jgi:hypothetical protein
MKRQSQGRGVQFWAVLGVLTVGAVVVAGIGGVDAAGAAQIASGQLRSRNADGSSPGNEQTHCAVVNLGSAAITVRIAILDGNNGSTCNDDVQTINPFESRGVNCTSDQGTYCVVTGTFDKGKVRGSFRTRDGNTGVEGAALPLQ